MGICTHSQSYTIKEVENKTVVKRELLTVYGQNQNNPFEHHLMRKERETFAEGSRRVVSVFPEGRDLGLVLV